MQEEDKSSWRSVVMVREEDMGGCRFPKVIDFFPLKVQNLLKFWGISRMPTKC